MSTKSPLWSNPKFLTLFLALKFSLSPPSLISRAFFHSRPFLSFSLHYRVSFFSLSISLMLQSNFPHASSKSSSRYLGFRIASCKSCIAWHWSPILDWTRWLSVFWFDSERRSRGVAENASHASVLCNDFALDMCLFFLDGVTKNVFSIFEVHAVLCVCFVSWAYYSLCGGIVPSLVWGFGLY